MIRKLVSRLPALILVAAAPSAAYDVTSNFSVGGVAAAAGQCKVLSGDAGPDDTCKAAMPVQSELSLRPTQTNEIFVKMGYGFSNGLNGRSPFALATWAADLEDDVEDINGRGRDYLLASWYKRTVGLGEGSLGFTVGIIDATDYLDENAFAGDEFGQFMNEVFVNSTKASLPSYDRGAAVEWESGPWAINAVGMSVGPNDGDKEFLYFGTTLTYATDSGNYRLTLNRTNDRFANDSLTDDDEALMGATVSIDQQFGENWGAFARVGWQSDDPAISYGALYSGGVAVSGALWGRENDNVGVGLAYLDGGNQEIDDTVAFETYYRVGVNDTLSVTGDVQWLRDSLHIDDDATGWIFSLRLVTAF